MFCPKSLVFIKQEGNCMLVKRKQDNQYHKQPIRWDNECQQAKLNKFYMLRKYRRSNGRMDLHNYEAARGRLKNLCRSKRSRAELSKASKCPREY